MTLARANGAVTVSASIEEGAARLRLILPELQERDVRASAAAQAIEDMRAARATPRRPAPTTRGGFSIEPMPSLMEWVWDESTVAWDDV